MVIEGVDYSVARPNPAYLRGKGKRFVIRYLYGSLAGKAVSRSEVDSLHAAGLDVVLNWEWQADEASGGESAGKDRAHRALDCLHALGAPADSVVYFSVDSDTVTTAQARAYFTGIRAVFPAERVGVYGGKRIIAAAVSEKWCRYFWQTYAWSNGVWVAGTHIQQYDNGVYLDGDVDLDRALVAEFGQWKVGEDMSLTSDEIGKIAAAVWNADVISRGVPASDPNPNMRAAYAMFYVNQQVGTVLANLQTLLGKDFVDEDQVAAAVFDRLRGQAPAEVIELLRGLLDAETLAAVKAGL